MLYDYKHQNALGFGKIENIYETSCKNEEAAEKLAIQNALGDVNVPDAIMYILLETTETYEFSLCFVRISDTLYEDYTKGDVLSEDICTYDIMFPDKNTTNMYISKSEFDSIKNTDDYINSHKDLPNTLIKI